MILHVLNATFEQTRALKATPTQPALEKWTVSSVLWKRVELYCPRVDIIFSELTKTGSCILGQYLPAGMNTRERNSRVKQTSLCAAVPPPLSSTSDLSIERTNDRTKEALSSINTLTSHLLPVRKNMSHSVFIIGIITNILEYFSLPLTLSHLVVKPFNNIKY